MRLRVPRHLALGLTTFTLCGSLFLSAQAKPVKPDFETATSFGTVMGHVYFAGSNAPARLVQIALQPIEIQSTPESTSGNMQTMPFTIYRTALDGSFIINRVRPGTYYIVTKQPGFLSPFSQFTQSELEHPTPDVALRMASALPTVNVRADATATINIALQRGASIGGIVRFDDGTPFSQTYVTVERRGSDGKWAAPRGMDSGLATANDGHWEIGGLPPGDYRVEISINVEERRQSALIADGSSMWVSGGYHLAFYLGDTAREGQATVVTLTANQQLEGADITIPASKMHPVSGAVVDQRSGQAVNAGDVELFYAADDKLVATVRIDPETRTFTFPFVLEGEYKLKTLNAHEARFEDTSSSEGAPAFMPADRKQTTVRQYGPGEIPVIVHGDVSGVNLPVEVKAAKPQ